MEEKHTRKTIGVIRDDSGFCVVQLKFTNEYVLSMNIGYGGYNDNRDMRNLKERIETDDVECAVFDPDDNWDTARFFPEATDGQVAGWQNMTQIETAIAKIMEMKKNV